MNNPYSVLGVSPSATDDEIKKAYRELARKYHPDNYHDNPLADLAQEKMKEINEAYDTITKQRAGGSSSNYGYSESSSSYNSYSSTNSEFSRIRAAINSGNLGLAEQLLNSCTNHNAEWNFLTGSLYYRKGWLDEARRYFQLAVQMDPGNAEYNQALNMMNGAGRAYRPYGGSATGSECDMCDICSALMCANMCCNCR